MSRRFEMITSWEQFQERWKNTASEAEAIGLLHALHKVPPVHVKTQADVHVFMEQMTFLLDVPSEVGEGDVADNARRIFATEHFLGNMLASIWTSPREMSLLCVKVLAFLGCWDKFLKSPPYPERIQRFLYRVWHIWRDAISNVPLSACEGRTEEVWPKSYTDPLPLVMAMSVWGAADLILVPVYDATGQKRISRKEEATILLPVLEVVSGILFGDRKKEVLLASLNEMRKGNRSPKDLSDEDEQRLCRRIAGRALLRCRLAAE